MSEGGSKMESLWQEQQALLVAKTAIDECAKDRPGATTACEFCISGAVRDAALSIDSEVVKGAIEALTKLAVECEEAAVEEGPGFAAVATRLRAALLALGVKS